MTPDPSSLQTLPLIEIKPCSAIASTIPTRSVCQDPDELPHDLEMTLASPIMNLTKRVMWAAPGPPCQGEYAAYRL